MELELLRAIQSVANPVLDLMMQGVTILGEAVPLLVVLALTYWSWNKELGRYLIFNMACSIGLNGLIKDAFRLPRPIGQEGIRTLREHTATGWSFPSGHTQSTASAWFGFAVGTGKRWVWNLAWGLSLLVALSRMYLGVHWPKDVVVGLLVGLGISLLTWKLWPKIKDDPRVFYAVAVVCTLALFYARSPDSRKAAGLLLGLSLGDHLEQRAIRFTVPATWSKRLLRLVVGGAVLGAVKLGMGLVWHGPAAEYLSYGVIAFLATAGCPWLFVRLKL